MVVTRNICSLAPVFGCFGRKSIIAKFSLDLNHCFRICTSFSFSVPAVIEEPPTNTIVNVSNNATFICEVAGVPLPFIFWTLPNGDQIVSQVMRSRNDSSQTFALTETSNGSPIIAVSVLYIESVSPGDEGEYTCSAINSRNSVSETATLTVQGKV